MDNFTDNLPAIIGAAAQSYLGILALFSVALTILAYFFFTGASEKVKVGIFVLLFFGVFGFGVAMFRAAPLVAKTEEAAANETSHKDTLLVEPAAVKDEHSPRPTGTTKPIKNVEARTKDNLVAKELHDKHLLKKLDAATRLSPDKDTEAMLRLYRDEVQDQLSPEAHSRLDQALLIVADQEFQSGRSLNAVEKYMQLFRGYQ